MVLLILLSIYTAPLVNTPQWEQALHFERPFQTEFPAFGDPCPYPTTVDILQTREALWVRVYAEGPFVVEKTQRDRLGPDFVALLLDPAGTGGESYYWLGADPAGNIKDQRIQNGVWDPFWNALWEADVKRTDQAYTVTFRIPFQALPYHRGPWRFNVIRNLGQTGTVCALVPTPSGQMRPEMLALRLHLPLRISFHAYPHVAGRLRTQHLRAQGGLDASLQVDLHRFQVTLFPDYGVADVDPVYVTLDRFAVYLPERRVFFTDDAELFRPPIIPGLPLMDFFYTRAIGDTATGMAGFSTAPTTRVPLIGGAKGILRRGPWQLGALYARTESPEDFLFAALKGNSRLGVTGMQAGLYRRDTFNEHQILVYDVGQSGPVQWNVLGGMSDTAWFAGGALQYATPRWGWFLRSAHLKDAWAAPHLAFFPYKNLQFFDVGGGPIWYRKGPFRMLSSTAGFRYWDEEILSPSVKGTASFFGVTPAGHVFSLSLTGGQSSAYYPDNSTGSLQDTAFKALSTSLSTTWNLSPHTFTFHASWSSQAMNYRTYTLTSHTTLQAGWNLLLTSALRVRSSLSYEQFTGEHPVWRGDVMVRFSPHSGSQIQVGYSHVLTTDPVLSTLYSGGRNYVYLAYEKGLAGAYLLLERNHNIRLEPTDWLLRFKVRLKAF